MKTRLTLTVLLTIFTLFSGKLFAGNEIKCGNEKNIRIDSFVNNEADVRLETWMTMPFEVAVAKDTEEVIALENWMMDPTVFMEDSEPAVEEEISLESWMTDGPFIPETCNNILCETDVTLESWMLSF